MRMFLLGFVFLLAAAPVAAFEYPNGSYTGEYGGDLYLEYQGEGMVTIRLQTEMCTFEDETGNSGTFANHGITARNEQGEVVMLIFYEDGYATVYADFPGMDAYCTEYNDATGFYPSK